MRDDIQRTEIEEWRAIPGFEGYEASSFGRIRSRGANKHRRILRPINRHLSLCVDGRSHYCRLADLVCSAFRGAQPSDSTVFYRNGDKADVRACNLEWVKGCDLGQRHLKRLRQAHPSLRWNLVVDYEDDYAVSHEGDVWSFKRWIWMTAVANPLGYKAVCLSINGKTRTVLHHRVVAKAFLETPSPERTFVNHKSGRRGQNNIHNLEWCTASENTRHSVDVLGTHKGFARGVSKSRGESNHFSKLAEKEVLEIYRLYRTLVKTADIAAQFCVVDSAIRRIVCGVTWAETHRLHIGPTAEERERIDGEARKGRNAKVVDERRAYQIHVVRLETGITHQAIATLYGITAKNVSSILRGKTWAHIHAEIHGEG